LEKTDLKYAAKVAARYAKLAETTSKAMLDATLEQNKAQSAQTEATARLCAEILNSH